MFQTEDGTKIRVVGWDVLSRDKTRTLTPSSNDETHAPLLLCESFSVSEEDFEEFLEELESIPEEHHRKWKRWYLED